ncbi:hypothetical protein U1Q18_009110 [Sarracenia purpurea var. burkii]
MDPRAVTTTISAVRRQLVENEKLESLSIYPLLTLDIVIALLQPIAAAPPLSWSPLLRRSRSGVDLTGKSSAKIDSTITAVDLPSIDPRSSHHLASNQSPLHHLVLPHHRDGGRRSSRGLDLILCWE